jgi:hypothetical protein
MFREYRVGLHNHRTDTYLTVKVVEQSESAARHAAGPAAVAAAGGLPREWSIQWVEATGRSGKPEQSHFA